MVLYLSNGKRENILSDDIVEKKKILEKIIGENLGEEAEKLFNNFCFQLENDFDVYYDYVLKIDEVYTNDFSELVSSKNKLYNALKEKKPSLKDVRKRYNEFNEAVQQFIVKYQNTVDNYRA